MQFGLDIAQQRMPWSEVASRAKFAEELGFDGVWGFDHFQPMYGDGPGEVFEGMTYLAAIASVTSRVRLGRLEMSFGAAWFDKEHHELGIPFPSTGERFDLLEDSLEIATRLFTGEVVDYDGKRVSLQHAQLQPQ